MQTGAYYRRKPREIARLVHHSVILELNIPSYRHARKRVGRGDPRAFWTKGVNASVDATECILGWSRTTLDNEAQAVVSRHHHDDTGRMVSLPKTLGRGRHVQIGPRTKRQTGGAAKTSYLVA